MTHTEFFNTNKLIYNSFIYGTYRILITFSVHASFVYWN
jgi:hypothetical protein